MNAAPPLPPPRRTSLAARQGGESAAIVNRANVDAPGRRHVLLIDDDPTIGLLVTRALNRRGYEVEHLRTPEQIVRFLGQRADHAWDVILLDVNIGELNGLRILAELRAAGDRTAVVMLTGDASAATATAALRGGAFHYVIKPISVDNLYDVVQLAIGKTAVDRELARVPEVGDLDDGLVGRAPAMAAVRSAVHRVGASEVSVLVIGESGTGKELVARALHQASRRRDRAFVAVNCGAIPEGLIDSELFGHTRGAFTGATSARPGVFVEADGGTLFLDEIGDMPLAVQARLLRTLQEREVRAVGGEGTTAVDVRVIAATNVDLERAVLRGRFRADLYFRLNVVNLRVPPLRERTDDIPDLIASLLRRHAGAARPAIDDDALEALLRYSWPGNVRELENAIRHALAMSPGDTIDLASLPPAIVAPPPRSSLAMGSAVMARVDDHLPEAKRRAAAEFERSYLLRILGQAQGSIAGAARAAGIDRTNFRRLLQRHGIDPACFRP